jgi:hypothetical protein
VSGLRRAPAAGGNHRRPFAHYLKGEDNGIDDVPPIQLALLGTNEHLFYDDWPPADGHTATLWLRDGGALSAAPPSGVETADTFTNDPGTLTWAAAAPSFNPPQLRANFNKDVIAWQSAPLTDEVLLVGQPSVRLEVSGTASRYQVNVHLYDQQDGDDPLLLAFGTATAATSPAVVDVPLSLTGRRVPAGHRLRLEVTNRDDQDVDYTGASPLTLENSSPDRKDSQSWKWGKGSTTAFAELGDPLAGDHYAFCLYAGTTAGSLRLETRAPAGGDCDGKPRWKQLGSETNPKGFRYGDRDQTPDGLKKVLLKAGDAPRAKALVKGTGDNLAASGLFPTLPLPLPLTAQLQTDGRCWEVTYATAQTNDPSTFKAR